MEKVSCATPRARHNAGVINAGATPFRQSKNLPEAISLTDTPGHVFSSDASATEDIGVVSEESPFSSASPSQITSMDCSPSQAVVAQHEDGLLREHLIAPAPVSVTEETKGREKDVPKRVNAPTAVQPPPKPDTRSKGTTATHKRGVSTPVTGHVSYSPSAPIPSPTKHQPKQSIVKSSDKDATSTMSSFKPLNSNFARPSSGLLSLRTTSAATTQPSTTSPKQQPQPMPPSTHVQTNDKPDMSAAARSNPHLSVLADLLDHKVFTEEEVLLELEAIRKRSLLTTAPFNKRLLPILAWYLLRDKFGEEAATRYVDFLTCPSGTPRPDGGVNTTHVIASFLPRVNALRRERRETKERVRKSPTHHYSITPPRSPTEAGSLSAATTASSGRLSKRRRRCTPAFDALADASDIPSTWMSSPRTPVSLSPPSSPSPSSFPRDRLHLYTRDHVMADRQQARAEDRTILDVKMDAAATKARAKNVYTVVEASVEDSVLPEPSIFQPPSTSQNTKTARAATKGLKAIPEPLSMLHVAKALDGVAPQHQHQHEQSDLPTGFASMPPVSAVGMAVEEGISMFYHDGEGGVRDMLADQRASAMQCAQTKKKMKGKDAAQRETKRGGTSGAKGLHGPCHEKSLTVAGGTPNLSDIPCVHDDGESAQSGFSHECSDVPSECPYSYLEGDSRRKEVKNGVATRSSATRQLPPSRTAVTDTAGQTSLLVYSAIDGCEDAAKHGEDSQRERVNPYFVTEPCVLPVVSSHNKAAATSPQNPRDEEEQRRERGRTPEEERPHTALDLSASRTAINVDYYSILPDASLATQKPISSPASPSVDKRSEQGGEERSKEPSSSAKAQEPARDATQMASQYGSLLPGSDVTSSTVHAPVKSRTENEVVDFSPFDSTAASQLPAPSLFASQNNSAPLGEISAAVFSMFEQDTALMKRGPKNRGAQSVRDSRVSSVKVDEEELPYSFFVSGNRSANTTRHSNARPYSMLASEVVGNSTVETTAASNFANGATNTTSDLAFGSLLCGSEMLQMSQRASSARPSGSRTGMSERSSAFVFSGMLSAADDSALARCRPSRASAPSILGDPSQMNSRNDAPYGSLMENSQRQRSPAHRQSRRVSRASRTSSTRSASRSLSGLFRDSLHENSSSSAGDDTSEGYENIMPAKHVHNSDHSTASSKSGTYHSNIHNSGYGSMMEGQSGVRSANTSAAGGAASHGGYSVLGGNSSAQPSSAGGYGSMMEGQSGVRSANTSDAGGAASHGGYSVLGGNSSAQPSSAGGYGSMMEGQSGVRSANTPAAGGAASHGGYSVLELKSIEGSGSGRKSETLKGSVASGEQESHQFALYDYATWDSSVDGSAMDPVELQVVMKRLERPVSGLRENRACTFGEDGCRCALGGRPVHSLVLGQTPATSSAITRRSPSTSSTNACAAQKKSPLRSDHLTEDIQSRLSPVPTAPLQQRDINALPPTDQATEKNRRAIPVRTSPRIEGTPLRKGTGFKKRESPQPTHSSPSTSASGGASSPGDSTRLVGIGAAASTSRRANTSDSQTPSFLDADVHASRVTIISDPRGSNEVSIHNLPGLSIIAEESVREVSDIRQLHRQQQQQRKHNTSALGEHPRDLSLMAPVSILNNSAAAAVSRLGDSRQAPAPGSPADVSKPIKTRAAQDGVSVVGGLSVLVGCGGEQTVKATLPATQHAQCGNDQDKKDDDVSLRMPHDMTHVLFDGRARQGGLDCTTVAAPTVPTTASLQRDDSSIVRVVSPEVHAKHTNLATILASSRLDGSNIIESHASTPEPQTFLRCSNPSKVAGAVFRQHRSIDTTTGHHSAIDQNTTAASSSSSLSSSATDSTDSTDSDGNNTALAQDTHQVFTNPEVSQEASSQVAVAAPRRHVRMQPQPTSPESPKQRELRQRHRTILDVPGVPYVPSPDISTHIDKTEAHAKEKKHDEFVMRWAQRGLMWQRQEREAQMREEYHARQQTRQGMAGPVMHHPSHSPGMGLGIAQSPLSPRPQHRQQPGRNVQAYPRAVPAPMPGRPPVHPQRHGF